MRRILLESNPYRVRVAVLEGGRVTDLKLERADREGIAGSIFKGRVRRVVPGIEAAFVDIGQQRDGYLLARDASPSAGDAGSGGPLPRVGEEILVQAKRDPVAEKGARLTRRISLPGRLLVWIPEGEGGGVSRRIEDAAESARLARMIEVLGEVPGGVIVRTAAAGCAIAELELELDGLRTAWTRIRERARRTAAPAVVWQEEGLAVRAVRDLLQDDVEALLVDGEEAEAAVLAYLERTAPRIVSRVRRFESPGYLFVETGVERVFERLGRRRVELPSGGHLLIEPTEALVAIDVNSGQDVDRADLESTALATNLEAAEEIPRQLRLRDLGGLIVVDFIDMEQEENRQQAFAVLNRCLGLDPQHTRVLDFSEFGLVQITRRRTRADMGRLTTDPCPGCAGRGRVSDPLDTLIKLRRDLLYGPLAARPEPVQVSLAPITMALLERRYPVLRSELEEAMPGRLEWTVDPEMRRDQYRAALVARA